MSKKKSVKVEEGGSFKRRRFTEEFKAEAVQMLLDGHTASSICERLGAVGSESVVRLEATSVAARRSGGCGT